MRTRSAWSLVAAVLLLASAGLQLVASLERWVFLTNSWTRTDAWIEDSRFDYFYPADPWENLGTTAEMFGLGTVLLACGILAMARAAEGTISRPARLLSAVTASSFALTGLHALVSGVFDAPSPLQHPAVQLLLGAVGFIGLGVLGIRWLRSSAATSAACVFLLGASLPGYLWAAFVIAPAVAGTQSYDTTPWTETVVAATIAAAGLSMLVAAAVAARLPGSATARQPSVERAGRATSTRD
jgi:hypothetical protein